MPRPAPNPAYNQVPMGAGTSWQGPGPMPGTSAPSSPSAPGINLTAQTNPALESLLGRQNRYLDALESGTGLAMDIAGQKMRDAAEGGRTALQQSEGFRGVRSSNRLGGYDAQTQRGIQKAIGDVATERERTLGAAIQGGLGIAQAPGQMALAEKGLGLNAYQAQQAAAGQQFDQFMALLNAQRTSPAYTGAGGGGYYSGGTRPNSAFGR